MPLYEYECPVCKNRFEVLTPYQDIDYALCPQCGHQARKLMSVVNWSFGWRLTEDSHIPNPHPELGRKEDVWEKDV